MRKGEVDLEVRVQVVVEDLKRLGCELTEHQIYNLRQVMKKTEGCPSRQRIARHHARKL